MTVTRVKARCSVKGCPWPYDLEKHVCWARGQTWHSCDGTADHQHEPRRSKGKVSRISAILCRTLHRAIDAHEKHNGRFLKNYLGTEWGENKYQVYCIADKDSGEILLTVPIEASL